jgi:hypothetical protein
MLLQQRDEIVYLLRLQIEFRRIGADCSKAFRSPSVFHLRRQKIEEDEIDVLHLVGAIFHKLAGDHTVGNMTAHAPTARMRSLHNGGNQFRLKRAIDLNLEVSKVSVAIHSCLSFLHGVGI